MPPQILVVRERDRFSSLLNESGFETINLPLVNTVAVGDFAELDARIREIEIYDGVFLTSPAAAEIFLQRFGGKTFNGKIYILGKRSRDLFAATAFEIVYSENSNTAEDFLNSFPAGEFSGKKFLFPRGDRSLRTISETLQQSAQVDEVVVYKTVRPKTDENLLKEIERKICRHEINAICFFSPSATENFLETFGGFSQGKTKIAVIGTTTARKAEAENLKVDFIPTRATAEDFALELVDYLKSVD